MASRSNVKNEARQLQPRSAVNLNHVHFDYFGRRMSANAATNKLPQELIDRIVVHNVPTVPEVYRRWSRGGYHLHILNAQAFVDALTMLCMQPFHNETLRQIQKIVNAHIHVSGLKIERVEAWGRIPASVPEHITSRL